MKPEPTHFEIVGWHKYQHYDTDKRKMIWCKLYADTLSSEAWVALDNAGRVLMIACFILAMKDNGRIPNNPEYIKRVAYLDKLPDLKTLVKVNFLAGCYQDASEMLASGYQDASLDKRREEEKEKKRKDADSGVDASFEIFWKAYPRKSGKGKALESWNKLKPSQDLQEQILEAVQAQCKTEQWKKDNGQYIPFPATWLNQSRWLDSPKIMLDPAKEEYNEFADWVS